MKKYFAKTFLGICALGTSTVAFISPIFSLRLL